MGLGDAFTAWGKGLTNDQGDDKSSTPSLSDIMSKLGIAGGAMGEAGAGAAGAAGGGAAAASGGLAGLASDKKVKKDIHHSENAMKIISRIKEKMGRK